MQRKKWINLCHAISPPAWMVYYPHSCLMLL